MYKHNVHRITLAIAVVAAVAPGAAVASTGARKHHHTPRHHRAVHHARAQRHAGDVKLTVASGGVAATRKTNSSTSTAPLKITSGSLGTIPVTTIGGGLTLNSPPKVTAFDKVSSFSTGEPGSASDAMCAGLANDENDALDQSGADFDENDTDGGVHWYGIASNIQDYAETLGCVVINPID